jgi:co-chaperonin GroES (HSP10)|tara:strand:+ start:432 stop:809 length:378 start_codon:yes stop_codon:yes gene_type:complete
MTSVYSTAEVKIPENPPKPKGYHLLIVMPKVQDATKGGVYLPTTTKTREDVASIVGKVVDVGEDAYPNSDRRFENGPWCEKGDWVLISKYSGHRFEYDNVEMRLLNDDAILATLDDPTKVSRATT